MEVEAFSDSSLPVRDQKVNDVDDGQKEVSREIVEVKLVPLGVVESSPEDDGDHHWQGGGDVGQDPENGAENRQFPLATSLPVLAFDNVHFFVRFFSLHQEPAENKGSLICEDQFCMIQEL